MALYRASGAERAPGENFAVLPRPRGDLAGLAGLKKIAMLTSFLTFRAFAPKIRKNRLLPTHVVSPVECRHVVRGRVRVL